MKTLDRYLLKEMVVPFFRTMLFLTVLMVFGQMLKLAEQFSAMGLSAMAIFKAICYSFAPAMSMILPLSVLLAAILAYGRLAADGELTAAAAAGYPFSRLLVTPFIFGLAVSGAALFFSVYGEPWGIRSLQKLLSDSVKESLSREIQPDTFYNWLPGIMLYTGGRAADSTLEKLLFVDTRSSEGVLAVTAKNGRLLPLSASSAILFHLNDGAVYLGQDEKLTKVAYETNDYRLDLGKLSGKGEGLFVERQGMTLRELTQAAADNTLTDRTRWRYLTAFHKKLALPLAGIIFSLLGALLASSRQKSSLAKGLIIGVIVIGVYYYIMRTGELAAIRGEMPSWLAMWLPNMIFAVFTTGYAMVKNLRKG